MRENKKIITVLIYLTLSLIALFPSILHISHFKYGSNYTGSGSDSYSMMKDLWWRSEGKFSEYNVGGKFILEGYPNSIKPAEENQIPFLLALGAAKISNPVAGYNFSVFISFLFTFLCAHLLAKNLLKDFHLSILASALFTITGFHIYQCADHLDLSYLGIVPLFAFLTFRLFENKKSEYFPVLFLVAALSSFIHPYFTIILSLFLIVFAVLNFEKKWITNVRFYLSFFGAAFLSVLVIKLWQISYVVPGQSVFELNREIKDLTTYSIHFLDFLTPPSYSFFFPGAAEWKLALTQLSGSNYAENTLYLGVIPVVLLLFGIFKLRGSSKQILTTLESKIILASILTGILFSLSPVWMAGSLKIYRPSFLLFKFVPQFRTLSRLGVLVLMGTALLSAKIIAVKTPFLTLQERTKNLILAGLLLFIFLDQGHLHFGFFSDTSSEPAIYQAIEKQTPADANILELPYQWGYIPSYWMTKLKRRSFYHFDQNSLNTKLVLGTDLSAMESLKKFSKENKIDYVVIHSKERINGLDGEISNGEPTEQMLFYRDARFSYLLKM